ncbi:MAG: sulfur relay (sulfurtransferase) complex TusBCD TusD component (DsrE family) [Candidatus Binatia bacterium]
MELRGKKLGLMVSVPPGKTNFDHCLRLAETALNENVDVYFYCIDDGVEAIRDPRIQRLRERGLKLHVCAFGAERRGIPLDDSATFSGLTVVSDLIASTDRFVSFN